MLNKNHWKILYGILFMTGFLGCGEGKEKKVGEQASRVDDTSIVVYRLELPVKEKTAEEPRVIKWDDHAHIHILSLGTFTTPMQFDIGYADTTIRDRHPLLITRKIPAGEEAVFNISTFKKERYKINFTALGESGSFEFTIE